MKNIKVKHVTGIVHLICICTHTHTLTSFQHFTYMNDNGTTTNNNHEHNDNNNNMSKLHFMSFRRVFVLLFVIYDTTPLLILAVIAMVCKKTDQVD